MRVTNGKEIVINTWRLFHGCAEYKIPMTPYPEFRERLEDLGFADDLLDEPKTPEQVLALRRFSSPKLGSWRQEMGKKHIYFSFVNYSTKSFEEDREWVATYVVLKIRNETYQDVF
uniref:Uncharacterized protein n=1 Tax=Caenorhabditis japonica TaxID=281687 RepID=A0A8R1IV13_CAEJA